MQTSGREAPFITGDFEFSFFLFSYQISPLGRNFIPGIHENPQAVRDKGGRTFQ